MAKGNRRLRSVVEGAMEATQEARRAAAAEKIRQSVAAPPVAPSPPPTEPRKPKRTRKPKPETEPEVEPDMRLEATAEQRVPPVAPEPPQMTAEQAQSLRDVMLQEKKPKRTAKTQAPKEKTSKPDASGFAPIRGPGALLGRLLKETYRQGPNIVANAVAVPAFTAAGAGGAYLGTAATAAAIRGIGKLLSPQEPEPKQAEPLPQPDDYRSGFQRAIDERRKSQPARSGSDVIRTLSRTRGLS